MKSQTQPHQGKVGYFNMHTIGLYCMYLFLLFLIYISANGQSGKQQVNINFTNTNLSQILDSLSSRYGFYLFYNANIKAIEEKKSIQLTSTLDNALIQLFSGSGLYYKWQNHQLVVFTTSDSVNIHYLKNDSIGFYVISGTIIDSFSRLPLPFASIMLKGKNIGTVSNNEGLFRISISKSNRQDTISVSYIGYTSKSVPVSEALNHAANIVMEPMLVLIDPVEVMSVDARKFIQEALDNIRANYFTKPCMMTAFFRESIRENDVYKTICEAVVDISKSSYNSAIYNDQAKLFIGRKSETYEKTDRFKFKIEGGIINCIWLDIIKERGSFLSEEFMDDYYYWFEKIIDNDGRRIYVIGFDQKDRVEYPLYRGYLYFDAETKALVSAKFGLSARGMSHATQLLIKKTPIRYNVTPISAEYLVNYRQINGKWCLSNIKGVVTFKVRNNKLFFNNIYTSISELVVTDIDTENSKRFDRSEIAKSSDILVESIRAYDNSFWGSYNVIVPEKPLMDAIQQINIRKNSFKDEGSAHSNLLEN